jgi:hypothetical protein
MYVVAVQTWNSLKLQCSQSSSKELHCQARRIKTGTGVATLCLLHHTVRIGWYILYLSACFLKILIMLWMNFVI